MRVARLPGLAFAVAASVLLVAAPSARETLGEDAKTVEDLAYGEVLYHFYQDDYFSALTRLLAAQARDELRANRDDAELLLGGMYLSYGQHRRAGEIFERVLAQSVEPGLHDRAWFFLAKVWHQRGYLGESESALARIDNELPGELEAERLLLHSQVLMEQQRLEEALAILEAWEHPQDEWFGYSKYNIGVALLRLGRIDDGAAVLAELAPLEPGNRELEALRDMANVASGYALLQAARPVEAKAVLQQVRYDGPYSSRALLGVGWADVEQADYRDALTPWIELRGRDMADLAVQESLLAVPYAYAALGANQQAADNYIAAIDAFDREIERLTASIEAVRNGSLLGELIERQSRNGSGWYWRLDSVPASTEARHLYELMATHRFQEALKNYRDMLQLADDMDRWLDSLSVFEDILATRQLAYRQRLPRVNDSLDDVDLSGMRDSHDRLAARFAAVERERDIVALGTAAQQAAWGRLQAMQTELDAIAALPESGELRDRQRLLQGVLLWDLDRDYRARLWEQRKSLRQLERELDTAGERRGRIERARDEWPDRFARLTARIAQLTPRVFEVRAQARAARAAQENFLKRIAVEALEQHRARLQDYRGQAQFGLATVYDRAATGTRPLAVPGTGAPPGEAE